MRKVIPVNEAFFNDGAWYVLSSSSLGGSGLGPGEISEKLQSDDKNVIAELLEKGICLPLFFGCDCALDSAIIVLGNLSEREEAEWLGRIRIKLQIPCGEFMLMGGGMDEDFEEALPNFKPTDEHYQFFQKIELEPGSYLVEVYAFLGSYPVNEAWEGRETAESLESWWSESRADEHPPEWISFFKDEEYVDSEEFGFVEHIIRIVKTDEEIAIPSLNQRVNWVSDFKIDRRGKCPVGLKPDEVV